MGVMDFLGDHLVACKKNLIQRRHFGVQEAMLDVFHLAGFAAKREEGVGDGSRPGDIYVPQWDVNGPLFLDITVRNPCNLSSRMLTPEEAAA